MVVIEGLLSSEDYAHEGASVDIEWVNLDTVIRREKVLGVVPAGKDLEWAALYAEWARWAASEFGQGMILPFHNDSELKIWIDRLVTWRANAASWAKSNAQAVAIVEALPEGPYLAQRSEEIRNQKIALVVAVGVVGALVVGAVAQASYSPVRDAYRWAQSMAVVRARSPKQGGRASGFFGGSA